MLFSEKLKTFEESRKAFKPYGITSDHHNEIEINFCSEGTLTYLFQDKKVTIPTKRHTLFWGLVSHQIIDFEGEAPYFVVHYS